MSTTLKNIGIISGDNEYQTQALFEQGLKKAFERQGINACLYPFQGYRQRESLNQLLYDKPDALVSFSLFSLKNKSLSFGELLQIPHLTLCIASGLYALHQAKGPYDFLSFVDEADFQRYDHKLPGKTCYLPHAAPKELLQATDHEKEIDYLFLGTLFDYKERERLWKEKLPKHLIAILHDAILAFHQEKGYLATLLEVIPHALKISESELINLHYELELYLRGYLREQFLLKYKDLPLHVYGKSDSQRSWEAVLGEKTNFRFHNQVSFSKALELIKCSKFLFHHCPSFQKGLHERILYGLLLGAEVITEKTPYLQTIFSEGEGVSEQVFHERRDSRVQIGQRIVLNAHTWDQRAQAITCFLESKLLQATK